MVECCGTCCHFCLEPRWPSKGKCQINKKDRRAYDMRGCLVWKTAGENELEKRRKDLGSELFDTEVKL